jgi:hypothetical protein
MRADFPAPVLLHRIRQQYPADFEVYEKPVISVPSGEPPKTRMNAGSS